MASGAAAPALTEVSVRALLDGAPPTGPLPGVFLVLPAREDGSGLRVLGTLIRVRTGGFMVALPDIGEVAKFLQSLTSACGEEAFNLGHASWPMCCGHPLRNPSAYEVLRFTQGGNACRPRRSALLACSEQWIHEVMDDDTAGDYVTGEEEMWPDPGASVDAP